MRAFPDLKSALQVDICTICRAKVGAHKPFSQICAATSLTIDTVSKTEFFALRQLRKTLFHVKDAAVEMEGRTLKIKTKEYQLIHVQGKGNRFFNVIERQLRIKLSTLKSDKFLQKDITTYLLQHAKDEQISFFLDFDLNEFAETETGGKAIVEITTEEDSSVHFRKKVEIFVKEMGMGCRQSYSPRLSVFVSIFGLFLIQLALKSLNWSLIIPSKSRFTSMVSLLTELLNISMNFFLCSC